LKGSLITIFAPRMAKWILAVFVASAVSLNVIEKSLPDKPKDFTQPVPGFIKQEGAVEGKAVVQLLRSDEGMAYYGTMHVGGQEQVAIYDTGSFDVVLESKCLESEKDAKNIITAKSSGGNDHNLTVPACCSEEKCPKAKYNYHNSGASFKAGDENAIEQITYGSGPVIVKPITDHLRIADDTQGKTKGNSIEKSNVPFKMIIDHEVDLFKETEMTAIVGVGPGKFEERQKRLINHMGIKRFMVCFQENAAADGYWTWNDRDRSQDAAWMTVPVVGKLFWAVPTSNFMLGKTVVGCNPSCGGVVDTGTSLLTPPKTVIDAITKSIEKGKIEDCSDLSKFPDFVFKLGDHTFSLPPTSYIADAGVQQIEVLHQKLAFAPLPMGKRDLAEMKKPKKKGEAKKPVHTCVLLLSPNDESEQTQFGPMVILGMSLFRKYAVQFDLSGDLEGKENTRAMRFAESAADCSGPVKGGEFRRMGTMKKVDLDKLRISPLQQRLMPKRDLKYGTNLRQKPVLRI